MREPAPDYFSGQYERPNQPWVCGLACDGHACPAGPTAGGDCPALAECAPIRDGDRWQCNRSALRGGACDVGPTPNGACGCVNHCHPVRSLRSIRARFVTACSVLAAGVLTVFLSADWRDRVIAPGPLAARHAQLLARADADTQCASCHAAGERGAIGWSASLVVGHGTHASQSQLCIKCHGATISPNLAVSPHNLPADELQELTASRGTNTQSNLVRLASAALSPGDQLACSTCHREHHGTLFDLTAIDNAACQACHQQQYESFATDHPDFGIWPYERRTRIEFNHASHSSKHFAEKKQTFDCQSCHVEDATHTVQLTVSYESACASCHDEKIATSVSQGLPMLAVPTLDVDALRTAGHDIGLWPELASGDFDGRLPPNMKLLLAADPAAAKAMHTLGADFDFIDVDPDDSQQLALCAVLATAIKGLFADLDESGNTAVGERLAVVLGRKLSEAEIEALAAGLSSDTIRGAAAWMPGVGHDKAIPGENGSGFRVQDPVTTATNSTSEPRTLHPEPSYAPTGAWFRDEATLTIRYRAAAHADPVHTGWLELLASVPDLEQKPIALAAFKELSHPTAGGLCASCHSIERAGAGQLMINWRAGHRDSFAVGDAPDQPRTPKAKESRSLRGFTKFSHGPHLVLPQLSDCTTCHAIDARREVVPYAGWDTSRFASEFLSISKNTCANCHTASAAGDRCQSCHNYHVDSVSGVVLDLERNDQRHRPSPDGQNLQLGALPSRFESKSR